MCWLVQNVPVLSIVYLHCAGSGAITKNETQRAERRCPYNMATDETDVSHTQRTRENLICVSRAGFLEEAMPKLSPSLVTSPNS